ncbi:MAG: DUF695 domain-containing protein [Phycisphaerae bacterium]
MSHPTEGNWTFYITPVDGRPTSIYLDLNARRFQEGRGHLMEVIAPLLAPNPRNGMTTAEEAEVLYKVEDSLLAEADQMDAKFVGRTTGSNRRAFYFYAPNDSSSDFPRTRAKFPQYDLQVHWRTDPEWKHYAIALYPTPEIFQTISNRGVVEALKKEGDSLQKPREITHWSYFPNAAARDGFLDQVTAAGFRVVSTKVMEVEGHPTPFQAVYAKADQVQLPAIDALTLILFRLSKQYGGLYDGWETSVEKETDRGQK